MWTALAGGGAERRLHRALCRSLRPGASVLDAGGGTGAITRAVLRTDPAARVTLARPLRGHARPSRPGVARMRGDITSLPLRDGSFDLVTAAWVLETLRDPARAVSELLRVLAPEGQLLAVFSAQPPSALIARLRRPVERHPRWLRRPLPPPGRSPVPPLRGLAPQTTALAPAGYIALGRCCLQALTTSDR